MDLSLVNLYKSFTDSESFANIFHSVAYTPYVVFLKICLFCFEIIMDLEKQFVKIVQDFFFHIHFTHIPYTLPLMLTDKTTVIIKTNELTLVQYY